MQIKLIQPERKPFRSLIYLCSPTIHGKLVPAILNVQMMELKDAFKNLLANFRGCSYRIKEFMNCLLDNNLGEFMKNIRNTPR